MKNQYYDSSKNAPLPLSSLPFIMAAGLHLPSISTGNYYFTFYIFFKFYNTTPFQKGTNIPVPHNMKLNLIIPNV